MAQAILLLLGLLAVGFGRPTLGWSVIVAAVLAWLALERLREMELRRLRSDGTLDVSIVGLACAALVAIYAVLSGV